MPSRDIPAPRLLEEQGYSFFDLNHMQIAETVVRDLLIPLLVCGEPPPQPIRCIMPSLRPIQRADLRGRRLVIDPYREFRPRRRLHRIHPRSDAGRALSERFYETVPATTRRRVGAGTDGSFGTSETLKRESR
jgi:hypothetical protein